MAHFDMPLAKLKTYRPAEPTPRDFDAFWRKTLAQAARFPLDATFTPVKDPVYKLVDVADVTFRGYDGQKIKGWFVQPAGNTKKLPAVVSYIGYSGGRGLPIDHLLYPSAGFAYMVMDSRGQAWNNPGDTPDEGVMGPQTPGVMTRGIGSRETYYYRRLFTDAARAVDAMASHPHVDPKRIAVVGGSQGGGIAIAAAGLSGKKVKLCMPDVPFLCHYRRATTLVNTHPYAEISNYLKCYRGRSADVFNVLAYFDGIHFAPRITARCLFSVGLMDDCCPPSTVFAAFNRVKGAKDINVYDFNYHDGGGSVQGLARLHYAVKHL
ncbi:MAG: acetylxylan esterase [Phycisphaerae bacterium]|nr:acetylxylan esterase [Phycisphaerae bacterium]